MIAASTLWFVALLIVGLGAIFAGLMFLWLGASYPNGDGGHVEAGGCLGTIIGLAAVICAIVGLAGGFA